MHNGKNENDENNEIYPLSAPHDPCPNLFRLRLHSRSPPPPAEEPREEVSETAPPENPAPPEVQPPETPPEVQPSEVKPLLTTPEEDDFVRIRDYLPEVSVALPYATEDNFTGQRIYEFTDAWLRYGTVKKLMAVQEELQAHDLSLKIWDAFRPAAAQFKLWEVYPDPTFVANPEKGFSSHSRGNTVDVTLVDGNGQEIAMPTGFDDFSKLADRDYSDCSQETANNALLLEETMEGHGFTPYSGEWWHFSDSESYPVEENFLPAAEAAYYADCAEYINLRKEPRSDAESIVQIPAKDTFGLLAWSGDFAYVEYEGLRGYVLQAYISPN